MKRVLNDSIEQLNFSDEPAQCAKRINQFVEQSTNDNIKNFIQSDHITTETQLIIVNAVYFKGQWVCESECVCWLKKNDFFILILLIVRRKCSIQPKLNRKYSMIRLTAYQFMLI